MTNGQKIIREKLISNLVIAIIIIIGSIIGMIVTGKPNMLLAGIIASSFFAYMSVDAAILEHRKAYIEVNGVVLSENKDPTKFVLAGYENVVYRVAMIDKAGEIADPLGKLDFFIDSSKKGKNYTNRLFVGSCYCFVFKDTGSGVILSQDLYGKKLLSAKTDAIRRHAKGDEYIETHQENEKNVGDLPTNAILFKKK